MSGLSGNSDNSVGLPANPSTEELKQQIKQASTKTPNPEDKSKQPTL